MTKKCRYLLLTLILAISLVACSCLFIACDETPQDTTVTYTVTVKKNAATPAQGVTVQLSKGSVDFDAKTTDANGKVEFELAPDNYTVSLDDLPDGYSIGNDADLTLTADKKDLTITLEKNFAYTIKLVDQNGAAFYQAGVTVMICTIEEGNTPGTCLTPVALGSNGIATIEAAPYNYHAKINGLPETAKYDCDSEGYYTVETLTATKTELTITVTTYAITSVTDSTPMTMEEKTAYAEKSSYIADEDVAAYHFKTTLNADKTAYYSITPEFDGDYNIYYTSGNASNYLLSGTTFNGDNQGRGLYTAIGTLQAGNTYYITVYNNQETAGEFEFVIEAPSASHSQVTLVGDIDVTIVKEGANAIIEFMPSIGAAFKLTGPEDLRASIIEYNYNPSHPADSYKTSAECTARFTEERVGSAGILFFSVAVENVSQYPVTFKVKLEKTANLTNTTNEKHAEATLEQYGEQQGSLTYVPMDGTVELVKDGDGIYHLGTVDGPVVVVMLTGNLPANRFASTERGALVYIDKNVDNNSYKLILDVTADKTSLTQGNTFNDYRLMLRGFAEYNKTPTSMGGVSLDIPGADEITEQHYYAKYVNDDGVYPLTDELKTFLQVFAAVYSNKITAAEGKEWMFACCYYDNETPGPGEEDVIVGEYESEDGYKLTVNANGTYTVESLGLMGRVEETGTWSKDGENTYKFTWTDMNAVYDITLDTTNGTITWIDTEMDNTEPYGVFELVAENGEEDVIVGEYENEDGSTLTVNADGSYIIIEGMGSLSGTWTKNPNGSYMFVENNPTFGDTPFLVVIESNKILFYEIIENEPNMDEAFYEFDVKGDDNSDDEDAIVGTFENEEGATLTVNAEGTYAMTDAMGSLTGTWSKTPRGTYLFVENNPTFGECTFLVVIEANKILFYEVTDEGTNMDEAFYEFDVKGENSGDDEDEIVGEYVMEGFMGNTTLTVSKDGSFSIVETMGTIVGTWTANDDGTYAFIAPGDPFDYEYTVTRNATDGSLKFHDDYEEDPDYFTYEFDTVGSEGEDDPTPDDKDAIVGEYSMGNQMMGNYKTLTVNEDGTWSIFDGMGTVTGTWSKNPRGIYVFVEPYDEELGGDIYYTIERNEESGMLKFYDYMVSDEEPVYEFEVVGGESE